MRNAIKRIYLKARKIVRAEIVHLPAVRNHDKRDEILDIGLHVVIGDLVSISHPIMLVIGDSVRIDDFCLLNSAGGIRIGDYSYISSGVEINTEISAEYDPKLNKWRSLYYAPVHIDRSVYIGRNVRIGPGVHIGKGARIASGSIVNQNVEPGAVIGDLAEFESSAHQDRGGSFLSWKTFETHFSAVNDKGKSAGEMGQNLFFIVSTGRSGSQTIARVLSKHPDVECRHEPKGELIRLSTEYAHGLKSRAEIKKEIGELYNSASNIHSLFYGESDNKISNLISIFHEVFPLAKFIWVVRNARDVVASTYSRGMFDDREYGLPFRSDIGVQKIASGSLYSVFRINGSLVDREFSRDKWNSASPFERNCWYWKYWNQLIEKQLSELPAEAWLMVRLEDLSNDMKSISALLNLEDYDFKMEHNNKAHYRIEKDWSNEYESIFSDYCGQFNSALYPL